MDEQGRETGVIYRRKQACVRCHTKRIKCLGVVPCRNCAQSNSPCIFPPSRRGFSQFTINQSPNLNIERTQSFDTRPDDLAWKNYRRPEKDFRSSQSSHSRDLLMAQPNYHGNPSNTSFIEQFISWVQSQTSTIAMNKDNNFDLSWPTWASSGSHPGDAAIEISIDADAVGVENPRRTAQPMKLHLPSYNHSLHLIQVLEASLGKEQHYFRRQHLRSQLSQMHENPNASESKDHGWLCYWLSVVALGELYNSGRIASGSIRDGTSHYEPLRDGLPGLEYYQQAVSLLQQVAEAPDMQFIETLCLMTIYAFALNKVNTAYMFVGIALRAALSLDLHRDPSTTSSRRLYVPHKDLEHQKRVFWTVYYQDLLTTTATGRPWGVLDNEITIEYADSSNLITGIMQEFGDSDASNAHLELMRLKSQAYSSLYGYAGTAISPQSEISLFDFKLSDRLSKEHIEKIVAFQRGLVEWHDQLADNLRPVKSSDHFIIDADHVNSNLFLIYHETILCLLRPVLVNCYNDWFNQQLGTFFPVLAQHHEMQEIEAATMLALYNDALASARQIADMIRWQLQTGNLVIFSYFDASFVLSAAITFMIARAMHPDVPSQDTEQVSSRFVFTPQDQLSYDTIQRVLLYQVSMGNIPAADHREQLMTLESKLDTLHKMLTETRAVSHHSEEPNLIHDFIYGQSM